MGGSKAPWRHDRRNGVGFCTWHHIPLLHCGGQAEIYWTRYWERDGVERFGWLGGQVITVDEYDNSRGELNAVT